MNEINRFNCIFIFYRYIHIMDHLLNSDFYTLRPRELASAASSTDLGSIQSQTPNPSRSFSSLQIIQQSNSTSPFLQSQPVKTEDLKLLRNISANSLLYVFVRHRAMACQCILQFLDLRSIMKLACTHPKLRSSID